MIKEKEDDDDSLLLVLVLFLLLSLLFLFEFTFMRLRGGKERIESLQIIKEANTNRRVALLIFVVTLFVVRAEIEQPQRRAL